MAIPPIIPVIYVSAWNNSLKGIVNPDITQITIAPGYLSMA
ncbi:hypothetical protein [Desertivirga arenae]|nr:hypothetical protein [Pedobacter sp. SYSU D00823]